MTSGNSDAVNSEQGRVLKDSQVVVNSGSSQTEVSGKIGAVDPWTFQDFRRHPPSCCACQRDARAFQAAVGRGKDEPCLPDSDSEHLGLSLETLQMIGNRREPDTQ